jgi:hypothetical protein
MEDTKKGFDQWALVELFGHNKIAGRVSECNVAGGAFIRVDVPANDERGVPAFSRLFHPNAIYGITPMDEAAVRQLSIGIGGMPLTPWDTRQLVEKMAEKNLADRGLGLPPGTASDGLDTDDDDEFPEENEPEEDGDDDDDETTSHN